MVSFSSFPYYSCTQGCGGVTVPPLFRHKSGYGAHGGGRATDTSPLTRGLRTRQTPWRAQVHPPPFGCGPQVSAAGAPDSLRRHAKGGTETRGKCQLPLAGDAHSCMTCAQQKHKHAYGGGRTRSGPPGTSNPSPVKLGGLPLPRPSPFRGRVSIVRPEGCASACIYSFITTEHE